MGHLAYIQTEPLKAHQQPQVFAGMLDIDSIQKLWFHDCCWRYLLLYLKDFLSHMYFWPFDMWTNQLISQKITT